MELEALMVAFAREIGFEGIRPDEDGVYNLMADDIYVHFAPTGDNLHFILWAEICDEPEGANVRLWRILMQAMFEDRAINGGTFSIAEGSVFLHQREALAVTDFERFKTVLESFLNRVESWRDQITRFDSIHTELNAAEDAARLEQRQFGLGDFIKV